MLLKNPLLFSRISRVWFSRILITWGICAVLMAFVRTAGQFYLMRFLLGMAEAGFSPGIIVYFTHWFARADRAKALSGLILAVPFSMALGAPASALLLKVSQLGLEGWQWVSILEGLPAIVLRIVTFFYLTDHPHEASWLRPESRLWLANLVEQETQPKPSTRRGVLNQALRERNVWLLALRILTTNTGGYALVFWLPTTVQNLSGGSASSAAAWTTLPYVLPYVLGLISVIVSGRSSDRTGDRIWHCVAGQLLTAVCLALSAIPTQSFALVMFWLCLAEFEAFFWGSPFWVLPTLTLTQSAAAVAIGFINMCANFAEFIGSPIVGRLRDAGFSAQACMLLLAGCYLLGAVFVSLVRVRLENSSSP